MALIPFQCPSIADRHHAQIAGVYLDNAAFESILSGAPRSFDCDVLRSPIGPCGGMCGAESKDAVSAVSLAFVGILGDTHAEDVRCLKYGKVLLWRM